MSRLITGINDPEIQALAGTTSAADKFPYYTGSGAASTADLSSAMRTFLTTSSAANLSAVLTDETFALSDAELGALAGLTSAANKLPYFSGSGTAALADFIPGAWTSFTSTWTCSSGNAPSLGNGTLTGVYMQVGKFCIFRIKLTFGTTTTGGNGGQWTFTVPLTGASSDISWLGGGYGEDVGTANYYVQNMYITTTTFRPQMILASGTYGSWTGITNSVPFTWGSADYLVMQGIYEVA